MKVGQAGDGSIDEMIWNILPVSSESLISPASLILRPAQNLNM